MEKIIFQTEGFVHSDRPENYKSNSSFIVEKDFSSLKFEFFGEGKPLYFHVTDPDGILRVQVLGKYEPKTTVLHEKELKTGVGTCPGIIQKGEWTITAFTFGARCSSSLGKVSFWVKVSDGDDSDNSPSGLVNWLNQDEFEKGRIVLKDFEKSENNKDLCWLKGDFHVHSYLSDGSSSPDELLVEGLEKKLDFFFITEHGILTPSYPEKKGITVFPSYEVTTASGHFNLPGIKYLIENYQEKGPDPDWNDIKRIMEEARKRGALVSINHPLHHPWLWLYNDLPLAMIDTIEIISDPYAENASAINNRTVKLLDLIWNEGYRITAVGGSDTHTAYSESQLGQPVTAVYAKPESLDSLLDGIKNHNVTIFTDLDCSLEYSIGGETLLPGTEIKNCDDLELELTFNPGDNSEPLLFRVVENGKTVEEIPTFQERKTIIKRKWAADSDWIRCEIRDKKEMIRGYCNPLYRINNPLRKGRKEDSVNTWGEAMGLLD